MNALILAPVLIGMAVLAVEWCVLEMLRNDPVDHTFRRANSE